MFPGIGGLNPKKMQTMMKQLGMSQDEIPTNKVIIEKLGGGKLIIENPSVTKMNIQGNEIFQISGNVKEETPEPEPFSTEDIKTIMEKTQATNEQAKKALEETGDLAEAILKLGEKTQS